MITLADAARKWAIETPKAPAWWLEQEGELKAITWFEVEQAMLQLAEVFARKGWDVGQRLVSSLPNGLDWAILDLACAVRGLIHVPIDYRAPETFRQQIVAKTRGSEIRSLSHLITDIAKPLDYESLRRCLDPDAVANILFTSGTTGAPRGVMLSHRNLVSNAHGKLEAVPQSAADRRLNLLPFHHAYARTCELSTWALSGGSLMSVPSFERLIEIAPRFQPTLFNGVPHLFLKLQRALEPFPSLAERKRQLAKLLGGSMRLLASGGAGLPNSLFRFFAELDLPIVQGYGLTEASPVVCSNLAIAPRPDCVGPPLRNVALHIDESQRLFVKGPGVMRGYWEEPDATTRVIRDGWLDTGDQAEQLDDGSLRILGRTDDRIVLSTGHKIDPLLVEQRLNERFGFRNCMLVGNNMPYLILLVDSDHGASDDLQQAIESSLVDHLPPYGIPRKLIRDRDEWSPTNGLLTAKGSLRRDCLLERFRREIEQLYFGGKKLR